MTYSPAPWGVTITIPCHDVAGDHRHLIPAREVFEMAAAVRTEQCHNPPPEEDHDGR